MHNNQICQIYKELIDKHIIPTILKFYNLYYVFIYIHLITNFKFLQEIMK